MSAKILPALFLTPLLCLACDAEEAVESASLTIVAAPETEDELLGACLLGDDDNACTGLDRLADVGATRRCGFELTPARIAAMNRDSTAMLADTPKAPTAYAPGEIAILVAVHVINKGPGAANGDVTNKQIQDQIIVLNQAYGAWYDGLATPFYFYLWSVDRTTNASWYNLNQDYPAEAEMKMALHKGDERVLNLYITNPTFSVGWSTIPSDLFYEPLAMDGVVLSNRTLPGGSGAPYNLGDNAVHEIGHWLGLLHTFQDGCGQNNSQAGDRVADTPSEKSPAYGCPKSRDSCNSPGLDPVTNYMDYSDDSCMNTFTQGQINRMSFMWESYRY